ncbi:bifunctional 4-hydroxy-2-oxoglutarate aldolase/2-dehydro-3-deoxy-phosphogluconate aldolase [Staphylococcus gallinarum]|jgi:2-dehydro-3-deoxyphosphogluconate aldolase/(4S)-4-hydroxy-2-oxoglutarate aldolase|uniref:Bifunctional 2-keto-4-hydroxyglutarate aldolase/2-keto-3-deoxy-6-phosphogluconate aldolase n=1 Tax=Staphylococcus gallinarum TaxID=1293 RepID=A0A418HKP0_STAGA|nr:bifunctional 4-hydroxy-2-oxoglutarate aldolase/2-dehydro-3-deoxy-phosphogluconate aldolase [Staphylococcus gallinarum]KIR12305.1 2-dehydro-3-deoxyphosphogluconate aldolase [Staphylococcus gallinarum]MCD8821819.1 bifunctional 4-hydroxy-2-oxoglutarate aldolase/2-dehydro-3-deoxy-phosphogluconate aldolase [Staphylococcus gallinarum]MCD8827208.1 bifunctional 4-hydroxy-2-oxoglutarate aldolase/2-dehydro-3-deoxy-phosphogluconate aldolase [Staphylococcus gallinarum]MCD8860010.1 bifunctional 4-hydroxy
MNSVEILKAINKGKHIAVMRTNEPNTFIEIAQTIIDNGLTIIEVTLTTPQALNIISKLSERDDALIGAGTVLDSVSARNAILNGAKFIVSPSFDVETAKVANLYDVPYIPGCMTVKEMVESLKYGCKLLKLFPATQFSPKSINDFKGPLPQIEIVPTGGIGKANHKAWLNAGSFAVGIGSEITKVYQEQGRAALEQYIVDLKSEV